MNCFMLQKCMKALSNDEPDANEIKVKVNCACCGSTVKETKIEDNASNAASEEEDKEEKSEGRKIAGNLLQSKSSSGIRLNRCFSCCCKRVTEEDKRMVEKASDVHITSTSSKDLSISEVLR